jgi:Uncharacterized protein related to methyl coenzyme M reductase subunit C
MYKVLIFNGGVYRFDELVEMVEDLGGMVLKKDHFHITRGSSYLSEEVHVTLLVPGEDEKSIKSMCKDIKGVIDESEIEDVDKNIIMTFIPVYDALSLAGTWVKAKDIENMIDCPCGAMLCRDPGIKTCVLDELDETLDKLCSQGTVKSREVDRCTEYCLSDED